MKNKDIAPGKKGVVTRVLAVLMAIFIVLALLCLAAPTARKKQTINSYGKGLMTELALVPSLISYYDGSYISVLAQNPADNTAYRDVSDALAALRVAGAFDSVILVVPGEKQQYFCAADAAYGSGAGAYSAGSLLSLEKPLTRMLGKVFDGDEGGTVSDLLEARNGGDAVGVVLPIVGSDGVVSAALAVQYGIGETQHNMLFGINLYAAFGVFVGIAVVLGLIIFLIRKLGGAGNTPPTDDGGFAPEEDIDFPPKKPAPEKTEKPEKPAAEEPKMSDDILSQDIPAPILELTNEDDPDAEK